jgi:four helix bundle protein
VSRAGRPDNRSKTGFDNMKTRFRFEKLDVWQEARTANRTIYRLARKFPKHEMFAMTSQIKRAAISISSNIAEGSGRNSDRDFAHFLEQAYGSLMETASIFYLALDEDYVSETDLDPLFDCLETLAKRIASLNRSLQVATSKTPFIRHPFSSQSSTGPRHSTLDSRPI